MLSLNNNSKQICAQYFQLVGETVIFVGSTFFLIDAIVQKNLFYGLGSGLCQIGSVLMVAQSVLLISALKIHDHWFPFAPKQ